MNMIGRPARCDQREALAARNAAQVSIELDGTGGGDERAALFGAKDTMSTYAPWYTVPTGLSFYNPFIPHVETRG